MKRLNDWSTRMETDYDNNLTQNGRELMKDLGHRMFMRLFDLISNLRSNQIKVQTTNIIRTQQSADEYLNGLLSYTSFRPNYDINQNEDYLLKYPDFCQNYIKVR